MTSFKTNMQEWSGGFAPPSPITAQKGDPWGELAAKLIPGAIDAVGKGYATAKGANLLGSATTAEEALQSVEAFDKEVPFTDDPSNTPDQKAQIEDMRNAALKKYGTNDKKLQALVSSGKISTLEANARRHQLLQESLSNPVLAMFKEDFLDASAAFTGGPGLTEKYFGAYMPTEEERVEMAATDKIITERAKFEADAQSYAQIFNISTDDAKKQMKLNAERAQYIAGKEEEFKLRSFSSQESFTVALDAIDQITGGVSTQLAAIVAQGQKFGDPATLIAQLEQTKQAGIQAISKFAKGMTTEDIGKLHTQLNSRISALTDMVNSADGHEFAMKGYQRIISGVGARSAQATADLMNAMGGPMWILHKEAPEVAGLVMGAMAGDKAAEFGLQTNNYAKGLIGALGIKIDTKDLPAVGEKIANGDVDWNVRDAVMAATSFWTGGDQGAKAEVEVATKNPDVHTAILQTAFGAAKAGDSSPLKHYSTSKEWIARAQTPGGAKAVANAIKTRVNSAMDRQWGATGSIPKGEIVIRPVADMQDTGDNKSSGKTIAWEFHTKGIDKSVQNDMIQVINILNSSPAVMKELGVSSPQEYLNKFFVKQ